MNFDTDFEPSYGVPVNVLPEVWRVTANNPGPFTFFGTNSYVVAGKTLAVLDPGPDNAAHFDALLAAIGGRTVEHILVSHTHRDHSSMADRLKAATGARTAGYGPHQPARPLRIGETNPLDASADHGFVPDLILRDGEIIQGDGYSIEAIFTPGHCANHLAFALREQGVLFSADHVMAWATSIVAPPDGAMSDYMASLDKLLARQDHLYLPGHGGPVKDPHTFVRELKAHRHGRESAILGRLKAGDRSIPEMVAAIYSGIDNRLHGAAGLSVLAHLEDLVARGVVSCAGEPAIDAIFIPA